MEGTVGVVQRDVTIIGDGSGEHFNQVVEVLIGRGSVYYVSAVNVLKLFRPNDVTMAPDFRQQIEAIRNDGAMPTPLNYDDSDESAIPYRQWVEENYFSNQDGGSDVDNGSLRFRKKSE